MQLLCDPRRGGQKLHIVAMGGHERQSDWHAVDLA